MSAFKDLTNQKFGRLTVIRKYKSNGRKGVDWECICECGNKHITKGYLLTNGHTQSCGCYRKEVCSKKQKNKLNIPREDLTGLKFNRLTVIKKSKTRKGNRLSWECICDCGKKTIVAGSNLKLDRIKTCGCSHKETNKTHGLCYSKEYRAYHFIKNVCLNKNDILYKFYGGKGITICSRWNESFENFFKDMGKCPNKNFNLLRRNKKGNYYKENCFWGERKRKVKYNGKYINIKELSEDTGINYITLYHRLIRYKWPLEKAIRK